MRVPVRAAAALVLLLGFFVLVLALTVGLAGFAVWLLVGGHGPAGVKVGFAAVAVAIAVGAAVRKVLKVRNEPYGAPLTREEYPELWRAVDELAVAADTRGPDDIRLVPEVNAAVWEESGLLGLRPGKRHMMVGLPLFAGLSVAELRAVLAHELGHYSNGHTKLSAVTYRATMALEKTTEEMDAGPVRWVLTQYAKLYAVVAGSANRAQELQADAASVAAAGKEATASALRRMPVLAAAWNGYDEDYVALAPEAGRTPELLAGFRAYLDGRKERIAEVQDQLVDEESTSVFDSHPPVRVRVTALMRLPEGTATVDDRPSWVLLGDEDKVARLEGELLVDGLGPRASWTEIVELAGAKHVTGNAGVLAKTAVDGGFTTSGALSELLEAVQRGQGAQLVDPLVSRGIAPGERPRAARHTLVTLLGDTVLALLVKQGAARFDLDWAGQWVPRDAEGTELAVHERIASALADGDVPSLRAWLLGLGVPLDVAAEAVDFELRSEVLGLFTAVKSGDSRYDLFVCDDGLLLVPFERAGLASRSLTDALGRSGKAEQGRLEELLEQGLRELRERPDSRWVGIDEIVGGKHGPRPWGWTVDLRLADGSELSVRSTTDTNDHGEPYEALGTLLARKAREAEPV
ncbi:Zn-dependent protease with chaperone function [Crossiella equi]|uniref:Zn-dependent protease with chaperone function n=1 Tax=Crossiella equi TaxID=130796 RepID=A0ABS5AEQ2_9PSEU|nr:M48 family metallopeptidase [Crossiella equi]MBP2475070.1 Zn-dependent protease with chaperone function [Crossiella equi]